MFELKFEGWANKTGKSLQKDQIEQKQEVTNVHGRNNLSHIVNKWSSPPQQEVLYSDKAGGRYCGMGVICYVLKSQSGAHPTGQEQETAKRKQTDLYLLFVLPTTRHFFF